MPRRPSSSRQPTNRALRFASKAMLLAGLLLVGLLAGCTARHATAPAPMPSAPEKYATASLVNLTFTAKDGTHLHATAYLPSKPRPGFSQEAQFGTVVNISPYYTNLYRIDTDGLLSPAYVGSKSLNQSYTPGLLLSHGLAYVAASVPGTGQSTGCFDLGGGHEQAVLAEFIDWIASQPWSNGNIGMGGGSYDGTTQWMAANLHPAHLKTIVPLLSITDMYDYMFQDGAPYAWYGPYFPTHYDVEVGFGVDSTKTPPMLAPQLDHLLERACPAVKDHLVEAQATTATGVYDEFWRERNYRARMPDVQASVLLVQGLWDWNVKPVNMDVWRLIHSEKAFWLQQMQHNGPHKDTYKREYSRPDWNATLVSWYKHYLDDVDNGIPAALPAVQVQDHTGLWRIETQWPPAGNTNLVLHLAPGRLNRYPQEDAQTLFVTPPAVVAPEGTAVGIEKEAPDVAVAKFVSQRLEVPLRIAGVPRLELNVSTDRPGNGHLVAQLWRVHANGTWEFLDVGGRALEQRLNRTHSDDVTPFQVMRVPVSFDPTDDFLDVGDRLGLTLAGEDPDWFQPNGNDPTYTILHGRTHDSSLVLPTLGVDAPRGITSQQMATRNPFFAADPMQY